MKKRIISLLLALSMMISLVPVSALANTGGGIAPLAAGSVEVGNGLTINANGVPQGNDGANGTNWTYTSSSSGYGTLTLKSGIYDFSNQRLKDGMTINVETGVTAKNFKLRNDYNGNVTPKIDQPATLNNNGGTVEDAELHGLYNGTSINVNNSGTIKNSEFSNAEIVNEAGATIEGSSLVRADSSRTWLKNLGTVQECALYGAFFRDGKYGTITNCVAWGENEFPEGVQAAEITIDGDARWTITDPRMPDRLATDKFYIVGSPTLKIQIWDDVKRTIVPLSNIDGDTNGITTVEENGETWYQFTPDSTNKESIVLNVREEHQLTVTGGGVIKAINGTDTTGSPTTAQVKETLKVTLEAPEPDGKTFKEWKVTAGTAPTNFVYKRNEYYNLIDNPTSFYMPEGDVTLEATYYNEALEIGADGKPVTDGRKPYGNGVQGDGWEYNTKTDTLTILTGHTESFTGPGVNKKLKVNVVVQKGAAVESGRFYKTVENHGTMSQALFCGNVTNTGDGTMNKCTFWDFDFTGNLTITITNEGEMEECIVMNDVTMLTNKGTMIRSSVGAKTVLGNGTYDTCLLAKNYGIAGTHKVTTKNETNKIMVRLVNDDGIQYYAEVEETEVYFTGTPRLKVQIGRYDDRWIRIPLTNVNGDENYGFTLSRDNFYIFAVPANSDVILNDTVKHTLTLNDAEIVNDDGTTPTSGTYVEGEKIRIRPNFGTDSEKVFDGWMSEDINVNTEIVYDAETNTYILTMPGKNATVDAKYKDKAPTTYTLTVVDGQSSTGKTSEELKEGTEVAVDANVPDDKVFTGWTASDGVTLTHSGKEVDLSENHLVFNMPAKTFTLTANFETARTNILFNEDGTLNLDGVKNNSGDGWYYSEGALYLNPATATEYDFAHVDPQNKDGAKLDAVNVPIHVVNSTVTIAGGTFKAEVESTVTNATFKNCVFNGEVDIQAICNVDNCIFTKSSTITDIYIAENCLFEEKPDESKVATKELTEENGATITSTLENCEGEVSGTKLYFTGTPTLKVKVADGIVEKANDKPVGKADANGWYTVKAAEDDDGIVLTKGEKTTPNPDPDDQPTTYTVTVKGGKINNKTEEKAKKGIELTVDVDEREVPEGMTFDVWSIRFPEGVKDTLTGNPSVNLHDPHMTFTMPGADITIEAQYRSSELPGEDDGPSTLGTMATVAVGGAAAGILVWQGVSLGVDSYLQLNLPKGVAVPANRRELVVLLWETAGKPEAALPSLYSDVPAEEIELQKATRWAIDNGLVKPADDNDASRFDPDRYVTKYDVFGAWLKLKKLMK